MSQTRAVRTVRPPRGQWTRPRPDDHPACPGCGRAPTFSQPDPDRPDQLLASCDNPACLEWVAFTRVEGRWIVARRISADERRNPTWPVARPTTEETARRSG